MKKKYLSDTLKDFKKLKQENKFLWQFIILLLFILLMILFYDFKIKSNDSLKNEVNISSFNKTYENNLHLVLNNLEHLNYENYFSMAFGNGNKEVILYLNPECPFSKQYIKKIKENYNLIEKEFSVKIILLELPHLNNSKYLNILSSNSNYIRLKILFEDIIIINSNNNLDTERSYMSSNLPKNILGTPTIVSNYSKDFERFIK